MQSCSYLDELDGNGQLDGSVIVGKLLLLASVSAQTVEMGGEYAHLVGQLEEQVGDQSAAVRMSVN